VRNQGDCGSCCFSCQFEFRHGQWC
jgi:hypothetical protein